MFLLKVDIEGGCMECVEKSVYVSNYQWLLQMAYFSRQNPFTRSTTLLPYQSNLTITPPPTYNNNRINQRNLVTIVNKPKFDNPFENSRFDSVFQRKKYQSESKGMNESYNYEGTYMPLSRYENRMRLRQMDMENWKREIDKEERYKLEHYGSEALRYSSFSTSQATAYNNPPSPKFVAKTAKQIKQDKYSRYRTEEQNPRSQYMLQYQKSQQKPRNKNNEGSPNISSKNKESKHSQFYRANHQVENLDNLQSSNTQSFGNQPRDRDNHYQSIKTIHSNSNQQEGRYDKNLYNNQMQQKLPQNRNQLMKSSSRGEFGGNISNQKQQQVFMDELKLQKKMTGGFSNPKNTQYMQNSFHKNQYKRPNLNQELNNVQNSFQKSAKSIDSDQNLIQDKLINPNNLSNRGKQMSYGSNFEKEKPNFYDSDYVNQDEDTQRGGPLNAMKFSSSSFESDMFESQKARPSRFTNKPKRAPEKIKYDGRQFYLIKL